MPSPWMELSKKQGFTLVHTFDDDEIIAGQGTVGLEILEQLPDVDAIVCPVGGGGLIAGIAVAVGEKSKCCDLWRRSKRLPSMAQSLIEKEANYCSFYPNSSRWYRSQKARSSEP